MQYEFFIKSNFYRDDFSNGNVVFAALSYYRDMKRNRACMMPCIEEHKKGVFETGKAS